MKRLTVSLLLCLLAALLPTPAHAEPPPLPPHERAAESRIPPPTYCDDTHMLAFLIVTEANVQPYEAHLAVAQIIRNEAESRGITICALARFTNFVTPYQYALAHPTSWHARQYEAPPDWAWELASDVLLYRQPDILPGFGHFDGRSHGGDEVVIGDIHFRQ